MSGSGCAGRPNRSPIRPSTSSTRRPTWAREMAALAPSHTSTSPGADPGDDHLLGRSAAGLGLEGDPEVPEHVGLGRARAQRRHGGEVGRSRQVREQRRDRGVLDVVGVVDGLGPTVAGQRDGERQQERTAQPPPGARGAAAGRRRCAESVARSDTVTVTTPSTEASAARRTATALAIRAASTRSGSRTVISTSSRPGPPGGLDRLGELGDGALEAQSLAHRRRAAPASPRPRRGRSGPGRRRRRRPGTPGPWARPRRPSPRRSWAPATTHQPLQPHRRAGRPG